MLSARGPTTLTRLEEHLARIESGNGLDLDLPRYISEFPPLVEAAIIQLIITWATFSDGKEIRTDLPRGAEGIAALEGSFRQPSGIVAAITKRRVRDFFGGDISQAIQRIPREEYERNNAPFEVGDKRSAALLVWSEKNAPAKYAPFLNLARKGEEATRKEVFLQSILPYLEKFSQDTGAAISKLNLRGLAKIVYELFSNSEKWGSKTLNLKPVVLPFRAILLRLQRPNANYQDEAPIRNFVSTLDNDCEWLLEASVIDSGIGLAQRFLGRPIGGTEAVIEELKAVQACLSRHSTSSSNSGKGLGLHHVMELATQMKGFLRLRTGRLHLFRDFKKEPYVFSGAKAETQIVPGELTQHLNEWKSSSPAIIIRGEGSSEVTSVKMSAAVKGSVITLLLPMKAAQLTLSAAEE